MPVWVLTLSYLVAAALFVIGLKRLGRADTAVQGNRLSSVGMLIAIVATLLDRQIVAFGTIAAGMVVGAAIGLWMARSVKMTAMPQMVALLNGFGGGASLLVGVAEYMRTQGAGLDLTTDSALTIQLSVLIGAITLTGSFVAFAKLQELMTGQPITYGGQQVVNSILGLAALGLLGWLVAGTAPAWALWAMVGLSLLLGVLLVIPIGGADMPVVISLLNSYSGIAAAMTGFVIKNDVLIIAGALVGSSGIILTQIMCRAMNRSLGNVLFGAFGSVQAGTGTAVQGELKEISVEDAAMQLAYAQRVVIVPGYGLAVAQAQQVVRELAHEVERRGGDVKYAIHPVAGRMPGHMNVLLAEANIPYEKLLEMEEINEQFPDTDVAVVIGANDVVNPAARKDKASPIYGMPILDVDKSKSIFVLKRGKGKGFAGIENELFFDDKTRMLYGDAKATLTRLVSEMKQV
jgi:NAD(P) transhydrogenase subunit beta